LQGLLVKATLAALGKIQLPLVAVAEVVQEPLEQMQLLRLAVMEVLEPLPQFLARQLFTLVAVVVVQTAHQQPLALAVMAAVVLELKI